MNGGIYNMIIEAKDQIYVTYRQKDALDFDKSSIKINPTFRYNGKPEEAWWGSPEDAEFGWKQWCELEEIGCYAWNEPIKWKLEPGSKIFQIDMKQVQLEADNPLLDYITILDQTVYPYIVVNCSNEEKIKYIEDVNYRMQINYFKMIKDGIVAVELMNAGIGHYFKNRLEILFNGWDCESICVLDPSKIIWL